MAGLLVLVFLALLFQIYPWTLLAANSASGWFSPRGDGASFFSIKVDGLPRGTETQYDDAALRPPLVELPSTRALGTRAFGTVLLRCKM